MLKWVSDTEVKSHVIPLQVVYPALTLRLARVVKLDAEVEAQDYEGGIYTQTKTGIEAQLFVETVEVEDLVGIVILRIAQIPYIAGIEEHGTVEYPPYWEAELQVGLKAHITHLRGVCRVVDLGFISRAEGSRHPATHRVGTTTVEHAVEGYGAAM